MLLAIETSCDETAVAVLDVEPFLSGAPVGTYLKADLISSQAKLHQPYGGVVPELASRAHLINVPLMVEEALRLAGASLDTVSAIAVTRGPGLKGCLLVGLCYAKALSHARGVPLLAVHHIEGHLLAGELLPPDERPQWPVLALVVSGGHTMLVLMRGLGDYTVIAKTRDDAAGEAFDKGATLLGLPYPGGPQLSARAKDGDPTRFKLPVGVADDPTSFSFSGLKTAVQRLIHQLGEEAREPQTVNDLSASLQHAIVRALVEKSLQAC
ncbi:MAG: tRNA (adenosine(37)-N6)-threonylcarbamoyltransferase complex transferase subunit TsaD, partial [Bdellovibrionales bacterium]|nr:tRNA (adenosine(37)-N6)-threonylcarbamoyltransferase complex transferase subunit TsaD [Bdellovibrionales bacterium]